MQLPMYSLTPIYMYISIIFFKRRVLKFDLIYNVPLKCPPGAPGGQISYLHTIPKRICPMIIHTKFEQNQMKTV